MSRGATSSRGLADVIVCDGFVGNVALKTSEGVGRFVRDVLRESLTRTVTAQVGALLSRQAFNEFRHRLDYREYGGAPLLGVRGVCIIGHGSSNDRAIFNGIRVAYESAKAGTSQRIEAEFASHAGAPPQRRARCWSRSGSQRRSQRGHPIGSETRMPADSKPLPAFDASVPAFDVFVLDLLACPACQGELSLAPPLAQAVQLVCAACGRAYPIVDGIPVLIAGRENESRGSCKVKFQKRSTRNLHERVGELQSEMIDNVGNAAL